MCIRWKQVSSNTKPYTKTKHLLDYVQSNGIQLCASTRRKTHEMIGINTHGLASEMISGWLRWQMWLHHRHLLLHHLLLLQKLEHDVWRLVWVWDDLDRIRWVMWWTRERSWHPDTSASNWLRSSTRWETEFNCWLSSNKGGLANDWWSRSDWMAESQAGWRL